MQRSNPTRYANTPFLENIMCTSLTAHFADHYSSDRLPILTGICILNIGKLQISNNVPD